jgi:hypothetical protein
MENVVKALVPVALFVTGIALAVKANREANKFKEEIRQYNQQRDSVRKMFEEMGKPNLKDADEVIARTKARSSKIGDIIAQLQKGCAT